MLNILKKKWKYIFADLVLVNIALLLSFFFRFENKFLEFLSPIYFIECSILALLILVYSSTYRKIWRQASTKDMLSLLRSTTIYGVMLYIIFMTFHREIPRSISIMSYLLTSFLLGGIRVGLKVVRNYNRYYGIEDMKNVLIIGAGDAGEIILKEIEKHQELKKNVIGFIDDDKKKHKMELLGKKIFGDRSIIEAIVKDFEVDEIIIAIPSADRDNINELYNLCSITKVKVKIVPGVYNILNKGISIGNIRDIKVEDLLGRETVELDEMEIISYVEGKTVLITGGAGSIGSELCRQIMRFNPDKLVIADVNENTLYFLELELKKKYQNSSINVEIVNIRENEKVNYLFEKYKPKVVFHAAAHKHVPLMENNPEEAVKNNVFGTKNIIDASDKYEVERFVLISTDKAVNPTNVMGATKRLAEMLVQVKNPDSKTKYMAVRFGNVLGSEGSVIPIFKKQIENGEEITLTHPDITRYFMTIPEATQLVLQAGALGNGGEVFVLDMGKPVKIYDLARNLIKLSGLELGTDIGIKITGLRPGEKLYEELMYDDEERIQTSHKKISIAKMKTFDLDEFNSKLIKLKIELKSGNFEILRNEIKGIVDTYKG